MPRALQVVSKLKQDISVSKAAEHGANLALNQVHIEEMTEQAQKDNPINTDV